MNEKTYLTKKRNNRNEEILMNSARRVLQGTDELRGDSFSDCYFFFFFQVAEFTMCISSHLAFSLVLFLARIDSFPLLY